MFSLKNPVQPLKNKIRTEAKHLNALQEANLKESVKEKRILIEPAFRAVRIISSM